MRVKFRPSPLDGVTLLKMHSKQALASRSRKRFRAVVAGRRWGKCFAAGTPIWMADGSTKAVEDVRPGELVLSVNNDYRIEPKRILAFQNNGVRETVTVKTASRSLCSTPNHPHFVNGDWVEAKDIKTGDLLAVPRSTNFGDHEMAKHELDLLAIWLAEGSDNRISNTDSEILQITADAVKSFDCRLEHMRGPDYRWVYDSGKVSPATKFLKDIGVWGRDSKTKFIPDEVFRLKEDQLARFLNLFFATDGCITKSGCLEIGLANERMVRQLSDLLCKFGIHGSVNHKIHKACSSRTGEHFESWRWKTKDKTSVLNFCEKIGAIGKEKAVNNAYKLALASSGNRNRYIPLSYEQALSHLNFETENVGRYGGYNAAVKRGMPEDLRLILNSWRKQNKNRCSVQRFESLRPWLDNTLEHLTDGDIIWEEVTEIVSSGEQQTFDVTVEDNGNLFANGVLSHNTHLSAIELLKAAQKKKSLCWYVAPSYSMARDIMWDKLNDLIPKQLIKRKHETKLIIWLKNGSQIQLKGADKPDSLRGRGVDFVVLDEFQDFKAEAWDKVIFPTLADKQGRALIIGTPKAYNQLYDVYARGQDATEEDWGSWQFPTETSPFIPRKEIEIARRNLDEKTFKQEFQASFETMSGRVYYPFERATHVGSFAFNPKLPILIGQDFNVDPMCSAICQYHRETRQLWVIDEIYMSHSNTDEVADEIERRFWRHMKKNRIAIYPDPAGTQRSTSSKGMSDFKIFKDKGFRHIYHRGRHPAIADRVNSVNSMLKSSDGTIRLYVDEKCKNVIKSLEQTIYLPNSKEINKKQGAEHMSDALGYLVEYLFPVNRVSIIGGSR